MLRRFAPALIAALLLAAALAGFLWSRQQAGGGVRSILSEYRDGDRLASPVAPPSAGAARDIGWDALMPAGWDPYAPLRKLEVGKLQDEDPRAREAMEKVREHWLDAPVVAALDGQRVRIPGFLIPIDADDKQVSAFLLVPYFGACIHTPPPPANQIIDVALARPIEARMMDAIYVTGRLRVVHGDSLFGPVAYRLEAEAVNPYVPPPAAASAAR